MACERGDVFGGPPSAATLKIRTRSRAPGKTRYPCIRRPGREVVRPLCGQPERITGIHEFDVDTRRRLSFCRPCVRDLFAVWRQARIGVHARLRREQSLSAP